MGGIGSETRMSSYLLTRIAFGDHGAGVVNIAFAMLWMGVAAGLVWQKSILICLPTPYPAFLFLTAEADPVWIINDVNLQMSKILSLIAAACMTA